jgi:hypothetical protein
MANSVYIELNPTVAVGWPRLASAGTVAIPEVGEYQMGNLTLIAGDERFGQFF